VFGGFLGERGSHISIIAEIWINVKGHACEAGYVSPLAAKAVRLRKVQVVA